MLLSIYIYMVASRTRQHLACNFFLFWGSNWVLWTIWYWSNIYGTNIRCCLVLKATTYISRLNWAELAAVGRFFKGTCLKGLIQRIKVAYTCISHRLPQKQQTWSINQTMRTNKGIPSTWTVFLISWIIRTKNELGLVYNNDFGL